MSTRENLSTQKIYPIINNDDLLEFRIPPNNKAQIDLGNVMIHFITSTPTVDENVEIKPQNFFGAKQFSSIEVRINGESVTRKACSNEYFLGQYFQYLSNYSSDYMTSAFKPSGIYDCVQTTTAQLSTLSESQKSDFKSSREGITNSKEYEILMNIDTSIFGSNDLMPSNTPIDISFERANADLSSILLTDASVSSTVNKLKDVYLIVPIVRDENMFQLERNAISKPIKIQYDDYVIKRFNIPSGSSTVMLNNLLTGKLPPKLFWCIQTAGSYTGSFKSSSTRFCRYNLKQVSLYIDGEMASDFPLTMSETHITIPYVKYLANTNKLMNGFLSTTIAPSEYNDGNFILSSSLNDGENGSLSFGFEFDKIISEDLILITCGVDEKMLKIDQHRNFQLI